MKTLLTLPLLLLSLVSFPSWGEQMAGMYYCNGKSAAGVKKSGSTTYKAHQKLTIKVTNQLVTISGDYAGWYGDTDQSNDAKVTIIEGNKWVYATGPGIFRSFALKGNNVGAFDFRLSDYIHNDVGDPDPEIYVEIGECQKW